MNEALSHGSSHPYFNQVSKFELFPRTTLPSCASFPHCFFEKIPNPSEKNAEQ